MLLTWLNGTLEPLMLRSTVPSLWTVKPLTVPVDEEAAPDGV